MPNEPVVDTGGTDAYGTHLQVNHDDDDGGGDNNDAWIDNLHEHSSQTN
jgi:hypothetical protein